VDDLDIPEFRKLMYPTLTALKELGGSARISEIAEQVTSNERFSEEQQSLRRKPGHHMSLIDYRLAWARNYLKNVGALENSARGVWAITDLGRGLNPDQVLDRVREYKAAYNKAYQERRNEENVDAGSDEEIVEPEPGDEDWKDRLVAALYEMEPEAFERLSQRVLREAGFRNVEVLGQSGDGGLDGVGVYRLSLVSFQVFFQCKRYRGSVGPGHVRDFRGAMSGRGEKGLLITTGTFTKEAKVEAGRDGAPPVELIDGEDLCELLKEYELGVTTSTHVVEAVSVDEGFFSDV
jgi:restriction system protein